MHGFEGLGFGMGCWWIIGLILIVAIIWAIVRSSGQKNKTNDTVNHKSPLDILNERYARGEIGKEEFEERKKNLL